MTKVIEIDGKEIPGDIYGVAYKFGDRLNQPAGYMEYGGATITARRTGDSVIVIVSVSVVGNFVSVPRIFGVNDGYGDDLTAVGTGKVTYPLSGDGATTQTLTISDDEPIAVSRDEFVYGNIDWKGKNTAGEGEPSDAPVLTWKGPTGRTIAFDYERPIEGLTTPDLTFGELAPSRYTCFGPHIYESGEIAYTAPNELGLNIDIDTKVLGCAYTEYQEEDVTKQVLVCVVINHYTQKTGFHEEVWINKGDPAVANPSSTEDADKHPKGWVMLHSEFSSRPRLCWFFNQSGTKATQGLSEYTINASDGTAVKAIESNTDIKALYTREAKGYSTLFSGSTKVWSDYKGDERVFATVSADGGMTFVSNGLSSGVTTSQPVYRTGTRSSGSMYVEVISSQANLRGDVPSCCSATGITWSNDKGPISASGLIGAFTGCGMATIKATLQGCDDTAQTRIRSTIGGWQLKGGAGTHAVGTGCSCAVDGPTPYNACGGQQPPPGNTCFLYCLNNGAAYTASAPTDPAILTYSRATKYSYYNVGGTSCSFEDAAGELVPYTGFALDPALYGLVAYYNEEMEWVCAP